MNPRTYLLGGLLIGVASCAGPSPGTGLVREAIAQNDIHPSASRDTVRQQNLAGSRRTAIVEAAGRIGPSVVSLHIASRRQVAQRGPWDFFFVPRTSRQVVESYGTGFVLRADGIIVTNQHVVSGAETITVSLPDNTEVEGTLLGEDPTTDIAIVRISRTDLPVPPLGTSSDLMIGEWVIALGNPYTYLLGNTEPTVTAGVVSATGRNLLPTNDQPGLYLDMIQTDAAINPGNSGGPLANALGEVVGLASSIFTSGGGSIGLGFAIPIERVRRVADDIIRNGWVRRVWTGLDVAGATAMRDWKSQGGVTVTRVATDGPADRAGMAARGVLLEANGRTLRNYLDWEAVKLDLHVGDPITLRYRTPGGIQTARLITGDLPSVSAAKVSVLKGLEVVTITPAVQAERGLRSSTGALIFRVTLEVAQSTGLLEGDVIIAINRTTVSDASEVAALLEDLRRGQPFRITFERNGQYTFTDLQFR